MSEDVWGVDLSTVSNAVLDRINTRRLVDYCESFIGDAIEDYLFTPDVEKDKERVRSAVETYLNHLSEVSAIQSHSITQCREGTWEEDYPFLPERLLAIEAYETIGGRLPDNDETREKIHGYPYKYKEDYYVILEDGYREYISHPDCLEEGENFEVESYFEIVDPRLELRLSVSFTPINPVSIITLDCRLD